MIAAVPNNDAMWTSCPQACMTATSRPESSLVADFAGIGKASFLLDGKTIEFGAKHYSRARPVFQDSDDSGTAHVLSDRVAQVAKLACQLRRRLGFMGRQFRILVKIKIQSVGIGIDGFNFCGE